MVICKRLCLIFITFFVLNSVSLQAADVENNYAYSRVAMPELLIGVGTRATGMAGAGTALSNDLSSLYWNPAGLQQIRYPEVEFIHNNWIQEINRETFLFAVPFSEQLVFGVGANYAGLGSIEKTSITADGRMIREEEQINLAMFGGSLGMGMTVMPLMSVGCAVRIFFQDLGDTMPFTVLGDLGAQYRGIEDIVLGLTVKNLGMGISGYNLPVAASLGGAYSLKLNKMNRILVDLEVEFLFHELADSVFRLGLEYGFAKILKLRTGYQYTAAAKSEGLNGLSAGLGVQLGLWTLGYSIAPQGDLGISHRLSLGFNLREVGKSKPRPRKVKKERPLATPKMKFSAKSRTNYAASTAITREEAAMRSLLRENIKVEVRITKPTAKTKGLREVHFRIRRASGPRIKEWRLKLTDMQGKIVNVLKGSDLPKLIRWNGKDKSGKLIKDVMGIRYQLILRDVNNHEEVQKGRIGPSLGRIKPVRKTNSPVLAEAEIFGPIMFGQGRAEISPKAAAIIAEAATFIHQHPRTKVFIEGYTDAVNEGSKKLYLSKARAEAVARYLTAYHKVPISRILVRGRGDKNPVGNNLDPDQRYKNRRVIITVRATKKK